MATARPGDVFETSPSIPEIDYGELSLKLEITTDRFYSRDYHERERDHLWMKVWQVAGREDDLAKAGDWLEYKIFDQSFVLARGRDGKIRGFVNACRHRGNAFCHGKGNSARFTCPYHKWSYGLDGKLLAVAQPDYPGPVEEFVGDKAGLGLIEVPVSRFRSNASPASSSSIPTARPRRSGISSERHTTSSPPIASRRWSRRG
jgi:nitrite reductase/ring-hydroxylating ferredoxin subunit